MLLTQEQKSREEVYIAAFGAAWVNAQISSRPALWPGSTYSYKLKGLSERGFKDPHKMIASLPAILGLSFENIDEKLKMARRLKVNIFVFAIYNNIFSGMASKNYIPILRECRGRNLNPTPSVVNSIYSNGSYKKHLSL